MPKKSFTESPLMSFITPDETKQETAKEEAKREAAAPAAQAPKQRTHMASEYKATADFYEPRSRRVQLLMRPSIYSGIQRIAKRNHQSTNNLIETVLADFISQMKAADELKKG